jgi:signal transduction histidine kinase
MRLIRTLWLALAALALVAPAAAQPRATLDQAKAMVKKARAYIREVGPEKAFAEINNPRGRFTEGEIYVFVVNMKTHHNLAHGGNPKMIGKDMGELRDTDGVYITRGLMDAARKGGGTFKYKFLNPATQKVEVKTGYAEAEGDMMVASGVYEPQ